MSALNRLIDNKWSDLPFEKSRVETDSYAMNEFTNSVLNTFSKPENGPDETTFTEQIKLVSKVAKAVAELISNGTISEAQGEILLKYLLSGFISKRVSKVFENIGTDSGSYSWASGAIVVGQKKFKPEYFEKARHYTDFELMDE